MNFRRFDRATLLECRDVGHPFRIEIDGRHSIELSKRLLNGSRKYLPNGLFVLKLDFCLCWMNVHIYIGWINFKIDEVGYLLSGRNQLLISVHHRFVEIGVAHVTPVYKKVLVCAFLAGRLRLCNKTRNLYHRRIHIHRQQLLVQLFAEYGKNTLPQWHDRQVEQLRIIAIQIESDIRMHQSNTLKLRQDIAQLR